MKPLHHTANPGACSRLCERARRGRRGQEGKRERERESSGGLVSEGKPVPVQLSAGSEGGGGRPGHDGQGSLHHQRSIKFPKLKLTRTEGEALAVPDLVQLSAGSEGGGGRPGHHGQCFWLLLASCCQVGMPPQHGVREVPVQVLVCPVHSLGFGIRPLRGSGLLSLAGVGTCLRWGPGSLLECVGSASLSDAWQQSQAGLGAL